MQELSNNRGLLRDQAKRLRDKLYLEKPIRRGGSKSENCGKTQSQWASTIRQAQKWKLETISLKMRNQLLSHIVNDQANKLEDEKSKRKSAQVAVSCLKRKVDELRYIRHANRNIIKEAQHWKQMAMLRGGNKNRIIKTDTRKNQVEDLEEKLKAAQRKLSVLKSEADKLANAKHQITEMWTEMNLQSRLLETNKNNDRLEATAARQIMQRATTNLKKYIVCSGELQIVKEWDEKKEKLIESLRAKVKELTEKGTELQSEHEKKLNEKEEEIRYLEYLHDSLYQTVKQLPEDLITIQDSQYQPKPSNHPSKVGQRIYYEETFV